MIQLGDYIYLKVHIKWHNYMLFGNFRDPGVLRYYVTSDATIPPYNGDPSFKYLFNTKFYS